MKEGGGKEGHIEIFLYDNPSLLYFIMNILIIQPFYEYNGLC